MQFLDRWIILSIFASVIIRGAESLRCYSCVPILQSGVDCVKVDYSQIRPCDADEDVCRTTAVSLPGQNGVRVPTINRECAKSNVNANMIQQGDQMCTAPMTEPETARISRMCQCRTDGCNAISMEQLNDNRAFGTSYYGSYNSANTNKFSGFAVFGVATLALFLLV